MKKLIALLSIMMFIGFASNAFAAAGLANSGHDFSGETWSGGFKCEPCHAPHASASLADSDAPLWNHTKAGTGFTVYTSPTDTMNATDKGGQPTGISKLCLGCHDGSTALDAFGASGGGTTTVMGDISTTANIGTNLLNSHPVSFTYDADLATADGELFDPTATASGVGTAGLNIDDDMLYGSGKDKVECASCHDVHKKYDNEKILIKANTGSALCTTCHNK